MHNALKKNVHTNLTDNKLKSMLNMKAFTDPRTGTAMYKFQHPQKGSTLAKLEHPNTEIKKKVDSLVRDHIIASIRVKLPDELSDDEKNEKAELIGNKIFDNPKFRGKLDKKIDSMTIQLEGQGYTTLDELRHALVELIPIACLPIAH